MLNEQQLKAGFERNNVALDKATSNQLFNIFETIVPTGDQVHHIILLPKSAVKYRIEYINIGLPFDGAVLDNLFFLLTSDALGLKYVSENLRKGQLGAKVSLFTSPGADKRNSMAGSEVKKQYTGMLPIMIDFQGTEEVTLIMRGTGLSNLSGIDVLISGHMYNRTQLGGGYHGDI